MQKVINKSNKLVILYIYISLNKNLSIDENSKYDVIGVVPIYNG